MISATAVWVVAKVETLTDQGSCEPGTRPQIFVKDSTEMKETDPSTTMKQHDRSEKVLWRTKLLSKVQKRHVAWPADDVDDMFSEEPERRKHQLYQKLALRTISTDVT